MQGEDHKLDPRFNLLMKGRAAGSFIARDDGALLNLSSEDGGTVRISKDDGKHWSPFSKMYEGPGPGRPSRDYETGLALKTKDDVIVWIYRDQENRDWNWDETRLAPTGEARLDVWSIRSTDGGKTWVDRRRVFRGYCGAVNDIKLLRNGDIIIPVQRLLYDPARHAQCTYKSSDNGLTWTRSNIIDLGGHGHHDGAFEGTLVELRDGRLWMLLRTPWDRFWSAYSWNGGFTWQQIQPTNLINSNAPGYITRLASGRLALARNGLPRNVVPRPLRDLRPEAKIRRTNNPYHHHNRQSTQLPEICYRKKMLLTFSEDDGETWSKPIEFVSGGCGYPQIWERRPGELWISYAAKGGPFLLGVKEKDLINN